MRRSGQGRFDIVCRERRGWEYAFVLEFKVSDDPRKMMKDAENALKQIKDKEYIEDLQAEGFEKIFTYGFSFCNKKCRVAQGKIYGLV